MNKAASMISLVLLWVLAAGCESQGTKARVHLRVFEVPTQVLRLHMSDRSPRKLSDSAYSVSVVTPRDLDAMLRSPGRQPASARRKHAGHQRLAGTGGHVGLFARLCRDEAGHDLQLAAASATSACETKADNLEVHLDYMVNHRGPQGAEARRIEDLLRIPLPGGPGAPVPRARERL